MKALAFLGLLAAVAVAGTDDSLNFRLVGTCATPRSAGHLAVRDSIACVTLGDSGLAIVDVSDPAAPVIVGRIGIRPRATGVALAGDYAYVTSRDSGLRIISIADPANPVQVGRHDTPYWAIHVAVVDTLAYVADFVAGLRIISVANPASPYEVGFILANGGASGVAVAGSYAYVADASLLSIVNVSNPAAPVLVGSCSTSYARYVSVIDTFAYVADAQGGMRVVSVADPARPRTLAAYPAAYGAHVQVTGGRVYLAAVTSVFTFDPARPGNPQVDGFYDMPSVATAAAGDFCYVAAGEDGLWVLRRGGTAVAEPDPSRPAGPGLRLASNPAAGLVRVFCPGGVKSVSAINAAGRVECTVLPQAGQAVIAGLAPGVYFLRPDGSGAVTGTRLVVR